MGQNQVAAEVAGAQSPEEVAAQIADAVHGAVVGMLYRGVASYGLDASAHVLGEESIVSNELELASTPSLSSACQAYFDDCQGDLLAAIIEVNRRWDAGFGGGLQAATLFPLVAIGAHDVSASSPTFSIAESDQVIASFSGLKTAHFMGQEVSAGRWMSTLGGAPGQGKSKG